MFSGFPQMRPCSVQTGSWIIEGLPPAQKWGFLGLESLTLHAWSEPWNLKDKQHPNLPAEPPSKVNGALQHGPTCKVSKTVLTSPCDVLPSWLLISQGIRKGLSRAVNMWAEEMEWIHMPMSFDSLPFIKLKWFWERIRSSERGRLRRLPWASSVSVPAVYWSAFPLQRTKWSDLK